ncbi:MAG: peptidylprolyl isomerase, partial [Candidatus Aminicenantales bacterium]
MREPGRVLSAAFLALTAVFCLDMAGCKKKVISPPLSEGFRLDDPEKTALTVLEIGKAAFTNADFTRFVGLTVGKVGTDLNAEAAGRLFDDFIEYKLAAHRAAAQGINLTEAEKARILAENRPERGGESALAPGVASGELMEAAIVEKYLSRQVGVLSVAEEEIKAYFEDHKNEFVRPERFRVSQILVSKEDKAVQILSRLRTAGEGEFRRVARAESEGPEAAKGGLMGIFSAGQLPPELEKIAFALDEGKISRVIQTVYGFHLLRLDKKIAPGLMSYLEAVPRIKARLLDSKKQTAVAAHVSFLKSSMPWKVEAENLPFLYEESK